MSKRVFQTTVGGRPLIVEVGEMAKQANASALVRYGDTTILSVVTSKNEPSTGDFFPLMVIYQERLYAAGKILKNKWGAKNERTCPLWCFHQRRAVGNI